MRRMRVGWCFAACVLAPLAASAAPQVAPPYSAPFALRSVLPGTALRVDTSLATSSTTAGASTSVVQFLSVSARVADHLAFNLRAGWVDLARSPTLTGTAATNLALGAMYGAARGDFRFAASAGLGFPVASGGGDLPAAPAKAAIGSAALTRAGLDNAMFGPNDLSLSIGGDAAYLAGGFIAQLEATVIQAWRVRAADSQPDASKTNATVGLELGYFLIPQLTASAGLRYQRFLSTPAAVAADPTGALRDTLSAAVGARAHFAVRDVRFHPGFSVALGLDDPLSTRSYRIYQLDLVASL